VLQEIDFEFIVSQKTVVKIYLCSEPFSVNYFEICPFFSNNAKFFISTIVSPRPNFRVTVLKFKMKVGLLNL